MCPGMATTTNSNRAIAQLPADVLGEVRSLKPATDRWIYTWPNQQAGVLPKAAATMRPKGQDRPTAAPTVAKDDGLSASAAAAAATPRTPLQLQQVAARPDQGAQATAMAASVAAGAPVDAPAGAPGGADGTAGTAGAPGGAVAAGGWAAQPAGPVPKVVPSIPPPPPPLCDSDDEEEIKAPTLMPLHAQGAGRSQQFAALGGRLLDAVAYEAARQAYARGLLLEQEEAARAAGVPGVAAAPASADGRITMPYHKLHPLLKGLSDGPPGSDTSKFDAFQTLWLVEEADLRGLARTKGMQEWDKLALDFNLEYGVTKNGKALRDHFESKLKTWKGLKQKPNGGFCLTLQVLADARHVPRPEQVPPLQEELDSDVVDDPGWVEGRVEGEHICAGVRFW